VFEVAAEHSLQQPKEKKRKRKRGRKLEEIERYEQI
jgi:hypothetical protein